MDCPKCVGRLGKKEIVIDKTHDPDVKELQGAALESTLEIPVFCVRRRVVR